MYQISIAIMRTWGKRQREKDGTKKTDIIPRPQRSVIDCQRSFALGTCLDFARGCSMAANNLANLGSSITIAGVGRDLGVEVYRSNGGRRAWMRESAAPTGKSKTETMECMCV